MTIYKVTTLTTTRAFHLVEAEGKDWATHFVEGGVIPPYRTDTESPCVVRVEEMSQEWASAVESFYSLYNHCATPTTKEG